jgi:glycosyltransferase involved in cell wall biosynthesis
MRIAINAWFWNATTTGSRQYTRCLVERLAETAPDLEIVLLTPETEAPKPETEIPNVRYQPIANRYQLPANLYKVWFEQIAFPRACRQLEAELAHVPYWAPPLRPTVPIIVTIHDLIPLLLPEYRGGPLVRLYTALVGRAARKAALVLTDSQASRRDIITHLRLPEDKVRTVYLAAGEQYTPTPYPGETAIRAQYGLPERYMLYFGGFDVRKNVATTLNAYRQAAPVIGETCPLALAGKLPEQDTPFTPDPRRLAREQGLDEQHVHFVGFVHDADAPAIYRGATALIFASHYEGFGLPPLEAMACGTPVVSSNATSIPEIVGDGGLLLPPDDAEGMARAMIRLATDDGLYVDISSRALAQAARFSWEQTALETLTAYRDVVNVVSQA